ncbi:hypothetical protein NMG60_11012822 [Bertholletia excelsa]
MAVLCLSESNNKENIPSQLPSLASKVGAMSPIPVKRRRTRKPLEDITSLFYPSFDHSGPVRQTSGLCVSCSGFGCNAKQQKRWAGKDLDLSVLKNRTFGCPRKDFR